jgi:hypothetical protein
LNFWACDWFDSISNYQQVGRGLAARLCIFAPTLGHLAVTAAGFQAGMGLMGDRTGQFLAGERPELLGELVARAHLFF